MIYKPMSNALKCWLLQLAAHISFLAHGYDQVQSSLTSGLTGYHRASWLVTLSLVPQLNALPTSPRYPVGWDHCGPQPYGKPHSGLVTVAMAGYTAVTNKDG